MGSSIVKPLRGFGLPNRLWALANVSEADSSYSQAGQLPGTTVASDPRSHILPTVSNDQGADLEVQTTRAGWVQTEPRRGGHFVYRLDGEASTEWRGYNWAGFLHRFEALSTWSTSTTAWKEMHDLVAINGGHKAVALYVGNDSSTAPVTRTLAGDTWVWAAEQSLPVSGSATFYDVTLTELTDGRLLALALENTGLGSGLDRWRVYFSDDDGGSWTLYDPDPFAVNSSLATSPVWLMSARGSTATSQYKSRWRAGVDDSVVFVRQVNDGFLTRLVQYSSDAKGQGLQLVSSTWSGTTPTDFDLVALSDGRWMLVYLDSSDNVYVRFIGAHGKAFTSAADVYVGTHTGATSVTATELPSGRIELFLSEDGRVRRYWSHDGGTTWIYTDSSDRTGGHPWNSGDASTQLTRLASALVQGSVVWTFTSADGGGGFTYDGVLKAAVLGGASNVEVPGWDAITAGQGVTYLPVELPATISPWAAVGSGTMALVNGACRVVTGAAVQYAQTTFGTTVYDMQVMLEAQVTSGGSTSSTQVGARVSTDDGLNAFTIDIRCTTTGFRIYDVSGVYLGNTVSVDMTAGRQFLVVLNSATGDVWVFHRALGETNWTWSADTIGTLGVAGSGGNTLVRWGHLATTTSQSFWRIVKVRTAPSGTLDFAYQLSSLLGQQYTARGSALPDASGDVGACFLRARNGPARMGESFTIDRRYAYGIENIFYDVSPSPSSPWKSSDLSEQIIAIDVGHDLEAAAGTGFLLAENVNWSYAYLEGYTGAFWESISTVYTYEFHAFLPFTRNGVVVTPNGTSAARYLWRGELDGGWIDLGASGTTTRTIAEQHEGIWNTSRTTKQARILLDPSELTGAEPTSGFCTLHWTSALATWHNTQRHQKLRLRIPSFAYCRDSYWQIGRLLTGTVVVAGKQWSDGWSIEGQPNADRERDSYGTNRVRRRGPPPRTFSAGWASIQSHRRLRGINPDPDYLSADLGPPLAARDDVLHQLLGLLQQTRSGEVPLVALMNVDRASSQTICDRTQWLAGTLASPVSGNHVFGSEGEDEQMRIGSITLEEAI